jgi:nitrate reductase gamma subunit
LFAAFLGNNPIQHLLAPTGVLPTLSVHNIAALTGTRFFPEVISAPFHHGLVIVFTAAAVMATIAALASLLRGRRHKQGDSELAGPARRAVTSRRD